MRVGDFLVAYLMRVHFRILTMVLVIALQWCGMGDKAIADWPTEHELRRQARQHAARLRQLAQPGFVSEHQVFFEEVGERGTAKAVPRQRRSPSQASDALSREPRDP